MGVGEERGGGVERGREGEKETERERRTLENYLKGHIEVITMRDMIDLCRIQTITLNVLSVREWVYPSGFKRGTVTMSFIK